MLPPTMPNATATLPLLMLLLLSFIFNWAPSNLTLKNLCVTCVLQNRTLNLIKSFLFSCYSNCETRHNIFSFHSKPVILSACVYGAVGASGWAGNRICMFVYIYICMYEHSYIHSYTMYARGQELVNGCCFCSLSASIYSLVLHSVSSPCHVLQFILHCFALQPTLIFGGVFFVPFICKFLKVVACVFCFCFTSSFSISLRWLKVPKADLWMR